MLPPSQYVFSSWKEIAAYLNKGVRTVQRWEVEFGLPVRRPRERSKGIVQATREDLDNWAKSQWAVRAQNAAKKNNGHNGNGTHEHEQVRAQTRKLMAELTVSLERLRTECQTLQGQFSKFGAGES